MSVFNATFHSDMEHLQKSAYFQPAMLRHRRIETDGPSLEDITQDVVTSDIKIKAQIQGIQSCNSSLEELNQLNEAVRADLAAQRRLVAQLEESAEQPGHELERAQLLQQANTYSQQLTSQVLQLRRANVTAQLNIEKRNSTELFDGRPSAEARQQRGKEQLSKMTSQVTGNLLSINRQLAEQVDRSKQTLDVLVNSSEKVGDTHEELKNVGGVIGQSGKLLNKYGRRELTDNVLFLLAFAFFFACVLYVVKKRLWGW